MTREEWRDVTGYEGYYQVSNFGRIKSVGRDILVKCPKWSYYRHVPEKIKKCNLSTAGYPNVVLSKKGIQHTKHVHRIVAKAFLPNPDNLPCIDHINGDKTDNRVENLRWVTQKENIQYAIESGAMDIEKRTAFINNPKSREANLKKIRRPVIRSDNKTYKSVTEAAIDTGCSRQAINHVLKGINKTCKGFTFAYLT